MPPVNNSSSAPPWPVSQQWAFPLSLCRRRTSRKERREQVSERGLVQLLHFPQVSASSWRDPRAISDSSSPRPRQAGTGRPPFRVQRRGHSRGDRSAFGTTATVTTWSWLSPQSLLAQPAKETETKNTSWDHHSYHQFMQKLTPIEFLRNIGHLH